jgi:DNA-binding MarR family transcriptional regulator
MARKKSGVHEYRGPLLGALLRLCRQEILSHVAIGLRVLDAPPLQEAVMQPLYEQPDGLRVTQLAQLAGVTKQSIAEMIDLMEAAGYVERVPDPSDGRARLVRLTRRGKLVNERARELVREVEERWAARIGSARVDALRDTLTAIVAGQDQAAAPSPAPELQTSTGRDSPASTVGGRRRYRA